jgi:hypothetical protein
LLALLFSDRTPTASKSSPILPRWLWSVHPMTSTRGMNFLDNVDERTNQVWTGEMGCRCGAGC